MKELTNYELMEVNGGTTQEQAQQQHAANTNLVSQPTTQQQAQQVHEYRVSHNI